MDSLTDQSEMPFGKYKGEEMENVPASYLLWLRDSGCSHSGVKNYIEENLAVLLSEHPDHVDA
jgi:uncharacterized protein (DUF3820 family)